MKRQIAPVILASDVSTLAARETRAIADPKQLENPFKGGMEIDEFRFYTFTRDGSFTVNTTGQILSTEYETRFELRLGDELITDGLIPASLFGPRLDSGLEEYGIQVWRLPKPLYLKKGERIFANMKNPSAYSTESAVIAIGRPVETPPKVVNVPYVRAWIAPTSAGTTAYEVESKESDLVNPFPVPLHLQRMVGNVYGAGFKLDWYHQADTLFTQIVDSKGALVVRDPTPFKNVFLDLGRIWNLNTIMAPRGRFDVTLRAEPGLNYGTPMISMVGYRQASL